MGGLPLVGEEVLQAVDRVCADALEDVSQVGERIDAQVFACGGETGEDGGGPSAIVAAVKHPVFAPNRNAAQAALGSVVVDLQIAVLAIADQCRPIGQRI